MPAMPSGDAKTSSRRFIAYIAPDTITIRAAQALRYRVFAQEMGARLHSPYPDLDVDEIDEYCDHLIVQDLSSNAIIGCTRLLSQAQAAKLGHFYSEVEFHIGNVIGLNGRFLEIGRTCVDPAYRGSAVLTSLWSGLAEYVWRGGFQYLMGCASIPPGPSGFAVDAVYRRIAAEQFGPPSLAVYPKNPVPKWKRCHRDESGIPPLLQAYLRLGAWVCGEPCWDEDFGVMDVFILLDVHRLQLRYERHFVGGKLPERRAQV